jgi:hypothetical protein
MANRIATVKLPLGQQGHSAYIALGDDELRRWETHCRGLEEGEMYPWAVDESRALVTSILGCLFGEDLSQLEAPSRAWARSNSTMAIFTRRLGCLRELVSQESIMNGPDSFDRLQEIFDKVTIVATEAALASLAYSNVSPELNGRAPTAEPSVVSDPDGTAPRRDARAGRRRRILLILTMAAIAALVAGLALALTSPPTVHHRVPKNPGHTTSSHGGITTNHATGGASVPPVRSGSGTTGTGRSSSSTVPAGTSGVSRAGSGAGSGNSTTQGAGASPGTSGSGAAASPGGATTVTLPGGGQVTVSPPTIP